MGLRFFPGFGFVPSPLCVVLTLPLWVFRLETCCGVTCSPFCSSFPLPACVAVLYFIVLDVSKHFYLYIMGYCAVSTGFGYCVIFRSSRALDLTLRALPVSFGRSGASLGPALWWAAAFGLCVLSRSSGRAPGLPGAQVPRFPSGVPFVDHHAWFSLSTGLSCSLSWPLIVLRWGGMRCLAPWLGLSPCPVR